MVEKYVLTKDTFYDVKIVFGDFNARLSREGIFGADIGKLTHLRGQKYGCL